MRLTLQRRQSPIKVFEIFAPLVDSPFAAAVDAPGKLPPAQVIAEVIEAVGNDVLDIRPGPANSSTSSSSNPQHRHWKPSTP